jgi:hypothetical protein
LNSGRKQSRCPEKIQDLLATKETVVSELANAITAAILHYKLQTLELDVTADTDKPPRFLNEI